MIKIGVSACLLGQKVRHDGNDKFVNLEKYFDNKIYKFTPICPEVEMGMSIPRLPLEILAINNQTRLVQVDNHINDYTNQLNHWFKENINRFNDLHGYILKSKSPSCGYKSTTHYVGDDSFKFKHGLFVSLMIKHFQNIAIINENQLNEKKHLNAYYKKLNQSKQYNLNTF